MYRETANFGELKQQGADDPLYDSVQTGKSQTASHHRGKAESKKAIHLASAKSYRNSEVGMKISLFKG